MGTIDKSTYTLSCDACDVTETSSVLDKGSNYGGSWWQSGTDFVNFVTEWQGGDKNEPKLTKASCRTCGASPTIKIS